MAKRDKEYLEKVLFNEKSLMILSVSDLREIGRKYGLPSSTNMNKKKLVHSILEVIYGDVVPPMKSSVGRPTIHKFNIKKYLEKIKKYQIIDDDDVISDDESHDYGSFVLASPPQKFELKENIEIRIFVCEEEKCYLKKRAFVKSKDDIEISSELADKMSLKNLDVVEIRIFEDKFKIVSINGMLIETKLDNLTICGENVSKGQIKDFYFRTKEEIEKEIKKTLKICETLKIDTVILSTNSYSGDGLICISYDPKEDIKEIYKKIVHFADTCEKYIYENEDVIILYENINDLENVMDLFEDEVRIRLKSYLDRVSNNLLKLGSIIVEFNLAVPMRY